MTKRHQNPRLAKIHRSYRVDEIADLYRVHKNTVLNWIKQGLPVFDNKRPLMILGSDLNAFHAKLRAKNKHPCKLNEIYCMKCKTPKNPMPDMVELQSVNDKIGNLVAICPECETMMYRRISMAKIKQFSTAMGFTLPQAHLHIIDTP